jgi:signal transduction histidine kinase
MRHKHGLSVTKRITLFTGVVAALLSTLLAVALMISINRLATGYLTHDIVAAGGRVAAQVEMGRLHNPITVDGLHDIQAVDSQGKVVASTPELRGEPAMAEFAPSGRDEVTQAVVCGGVFPSDKCAIVVAQAAHVQGTTWTVYSAAPTVPPLVNPLLAALVIGGCTLLAGVVTMLGHRIAARALAPLRALREGLDAINAMRPGQQVPVPPGGDEIHELADSVNHTLSRLQAAMEQQRQFASDASHDLRSPIAAMRAETEDALLAPEQTNVTDLVHAILRSLDRLQAIVCDLLTMSRLEAGTPGDREPVDLAHLVSTELRMRRNAKVRIECSLQPGVVVMGDRLRLTRLFTNLMDNAQRHAESLIKVTVYGKPGSGCADTKFPYGTAYLEVLDDGEGVPPDKRELVFQRFARLEQARCKDAGGTGLGLPIARQIAESTGGTLRIEDSPRGARFVLCLPAAPPGAYEPGKETCPAAAQKGGGKITVRAGEDANPGERAAEIAGERERA